MNWIKDFKKTWMKFASVLHRFNTRVLLILIFYLVITPFGLFFRLIRKNPMTPRFDRQATSYRIPSVRRSKAHMEKIY